MARLVRVWQWPAVGTVALGQGTAGGADAGLEQGGSAAGAHGSGGSGLGREQVKSRLGQGTADTGPAVGGSACARRGYWWRMARDLGSGTAHSKEWRLMGGGWNEDKWSPPPPPPPPPPPLFL